MLSYKILPTLGAWFQKKKPQIDFCCVNQSYSFEINNFSYLLGAKEVFNFFL